MHSEAHLSTTTTLYDLMSALQTQVKDDQVITTLMVHLLRTGRITFPQMSEPSAFRVSGAAA